MLSTIEVVIEMDGSVRLLEPLQIKHATRALLTLLEPLEDVADQTAMASSTARSSVKSIRDNPAFGMWADRTDSTQAQLQDIRQQHWKR